MEFTSSTLPVYCKKKQFFKYNLGNFFKYITFSSCSLIIFESLPKLYLKNYFFQLNVKMEGVNSIHDLGALFVSNVLRHKESGRIRSILLFHLLLLWHGSLWCIYTSVCLTGAYRKYIRAKKTDVFFLSNFTLSVSFTLMYFLSAPVRQTEV